MIGTGPEQRVSMLFFFWGGGGTVVQMNAGKSVDLMKQELVTGFLTSCQVPRFAYLRTSNTITVGTQ